MPKAKKKQSNTKSSAMTSCWSPRNARAEKRALLRQLDEANERIRQLESANAIITDNSNTQYMTLEDMGTKHYQDCWNQQGCSQAVRFPSPMSCAFASVDDGENYAFASMPGVHGQHKMESGYYSQPIWLKGGGYTLVGLVGSQAEKVALKTCEDFRRLPFMQIMHPVSVGPVSQSFYTVTLSVDMVNHTAALYSGDANNADPNQKVEPVVVWENLPNEVWVAIAMKRRSGREAVLLPSTHWDVQELET